MSKFTSRRFVRRAVLGALTLAVHAVPFTWGPADVGTASATPYASGFQNLGGGSYQFTTNEDADSVVVKFSDGSSQNLSASKGSKGFIIPAGATGFSVEVSKASGAGYLTASTPGNASRLQISDDANPLMRFNSPRGIAVQTDPTAGDAFGRFYVSNSVPGSVTAGANNIPGGAGRSGIGDGIYVLNPDQTAYSPNAETAGIAFDSANSFSPIRLMIGQDKQLYIADQSDSVGNLWVATPNVTNGQRVFPTDGGPTTVPQGQNHGSVMVGVAKGSLAAGTLTVYTIDEDLTPAIRAPRKYNIGSGPLPSDVTPQIIGPSQTNSFLINGLNDLDVRHDGKLYVTQNRANGTLESSLFVLNPDGSIFWQSPFSTQPNNADPLRNTVGMALSPDGSKLALVSLSGDVIFVPLLANGTPDIDNRLLLDAFPEAASNQGREVAFDAVGNLYVVSSGYAMMRIFSPGGASTAVTSFDGTNYSFALVPEPTALALLGAAGLLTLRRRRR